MFRFVGWTVAATTVSGFMTHEWGLSFLFGLAIASLHAMYGDDPRGGV